MKRIVITVFLAWVGGMSVKGHEVILSCDPTAVGNFSSHTASAALYNITKNQKTATTNASIFCSVNGERDKFVEMEFVIYGEPPKSLSLVAEYETLLRLNGVSMFCCANDISDISRVRPEEDLAFDANMTDLVEYRCSGEQDIRIQLAGIHLLRMDLSTHSRSRRDTLSVPENSENCTKLEKKSGKFFKNLGEACGCASESCRWMVDNAGNHVCSLCCRKQHWSLKYFTCVECPVCTTIEIANPFTSCMPIPNCKRPKAPTTPSTSTETEQTTSTGFTKLPEKTTYSPSVSTVTTPEKTTELRTEGSTVRSTTPSKNGKDEKKTATDPGSVEAHYSGAWIIILVLILALFALIAIVSFCTRERPQHYHRGEIQNNNN